MNDSPMCLLWIHILSNHSSIFPSTFWFIISIFPLRNCSLIALLKIFPFFFLWARKGNKSPEKDAKWTKKSQQGAELKERRRNTFVKNSELVNFFCFLKHFHSYCKISFFFVSDCDSCLVRHGKRFLNSQLLFCLSFQ